MTHKLVSPSLLSANFGDLNHDIEMLNNSEADMIHLDIMDGVFVPNISFGLPIVKAVSQKTSRPLDVHLMIVNPERYVDAFKDAGATYLTVHYEACIHLHRVVQQIKSTGMKAGVSLNPHTPVQLLEDIIQDIDLVLIMSVNPGFGGQKFIPNSIKKIRQAKDLIVKNNCNTLIEVDGGISIHNSGSVYSAGADIVVSGNAIFSSTDPIKYISELKK